MEGVVVIAEIHTYTFKGIPLKRGGLAEWFVKVMFGIHYLCCPCFLVEEK